MTRKFAVHNKWPVGSRQQPVYGEITIRADRQTLLDMKTLIDIALQKGKGSARITLSDQTHRRIVFRKER